MKLFIISFLICVTFIQTNAQHEDVYPGLEGGELLDSLQAHYTPAATLGYNFARDTLFANILKINDSLECLYSGFRISLTDGTDPTTDAFSKGINTEHIYPQAKGAEEEPMRSNMYNLAPTLEYINSDRGDLPYSEINDQDTKWWYFQKIKQSTIPALNVRDLFSESSSTAFEPREEVKGDIARSILYFYSIYRNAADLADPLFFGLMQGSVCEWHYADPVDQAEWNRNQLIAAYQGGKSNPFVLDCSLPERLYCSGINQHCTLGNESITAEKNILLIFPSICPSGQSITMNFPEGSDQLIILNSKGSVINNEQLRQKEKRFYTHNWMPEIYFVFVYRKGIIISSGKFIIN